MKVELTNIHLTDKISVPTQRTMTDAGQMIVPCAFARTGVQLYKGNQIGLIDQADEVFEVHRTEDAVFDEASMESFRSAPLTIGHPKDADGNKLLVTADNASDLQVGMLEGMPVRDEDLLSGVVVVTNQEAIDTIEEGNVELSAGYTCDINLVDGKYQQTNIKANHIAIVTKGRAGSSCSIADEADKEDEINVKEEKVADEIDVKINDQKDNQEDVKEVLQVSDSSLSTDIKDVDPDAMKAIADEASEETLVVTDMSEAEAAEAVAVHEEVETINYEADAEWANSYAKDAGAMAKAHADVAKAARKIANKKAKSMEDSIEGGGTYLADDVTALLVHIDLQDEEVLRLTNKINDIEDSVVARSDAIVIAKNMTNLDDFTGKTVTEIRKMVVADRLDIDLSKKSEAYIEARFEILCEDSSVESQMGKVLVASLTDSDTKPYVSKVVEARQNMINRNLNKNK